MQHVWPEVVQTLGILLPGKCGLKYHAHLPAAVCTICRALRSNLPTVQILRPLQRAKAIVWAYPFGPDMLSLMSVAARDAQNNVSLNQGASDAAANSVTFPAHAVGPAWRTAGRAGLKQKMSEHTGSKPQIRSSMLPDQDEWRAALGQSLRLLRKVPDATPSGLV